MVEFLLILAALAIYFAPTIVAAWRRHPRLVVILVINLASGFTGIGWIAAMFWAMSRGASVLRRYEYNSDYYGGMQVSSNEQLNNHFLVTCGALVVIAAVAALGLNRARVSRDEPTAFQGGDVTHPTFAAVGAGASPTYPARVQDASVIKVVDTAGPNAQLVSNKEHVEQAGLRTNSQVQTRRHLRHLSQKYYVDGVPLAERVLPKNVVSQ